VRVVGVSRDSPYSHINWAKRLLDTPVRSCFIVDSSAVVRFAKSYEDSQVPDVDQLLATARAMTTGG
jgi:alkyl hydroperoxide reductase subunit AhpC